MLQKCDIYGMAFAVGKRRGDLLHLLKSFPVQGGGIPFFSIGLRTAVGLGREGNRGCATMLLLASSLKELIHD